MTPMTRGSVMANTQRDEGSTPPCPYWAGSLIGKARRDGGFEIHLTMGHYIEAHWMNGYKP
jgi:hypothetical protein